ncbi:hypothetical protein [Foetidibacter luteolus]|uniref:hypothetical protein n=1 Tax=Foetidibacter luteolus TaxID=2608880 RepID=UPI00129BFDF4|nr:hypothetical protein [Foetidibacter luteolus]
MKKILQLLFISGLVIGACRQSGKEQLKEFIPGNYIRAISHEFAIGSDTLIVSRMEDQENTFRLIKNAGFRQRRDGILLPLRHTTDTWVAVLDPETGLLHETRRGKVIYFNRQERCLLVGSSKYFKADH